MQCFHHFGGSKTRKSKKIRKKKLVLPISFYAPFSCIRALNRQTKEKIMEKKKKEKYNKKKRNKQTKKEKEKIKNERNKDLKKRKNE